MKNIQQRTDEAEYCASIFDIDCEVEVTYDTEKSEYHYKFMYQKEAYTSWRKVCCKYAKQNMYAQRTRVSARWPSW